MSHMEVIIKGLGWQAGYVMSMGRELCPKREIVGMRIEGVGWCGS